MAIQIRGGQIKSASITSTQLSTGLIDNANLIGSSVIVSSALANDCVISSKIASGAIDDTAYLANNVVTAAKIDLSGSFTSQGLLVYPRRQTMHTPSQKPMQTPWLPVYTGRKVV